jgi:homoprotocatechuate degradation regulator HpaR
MHPGNPEHRNLPLLLLHAREAVLAHFRPILKQFHLTDQQWRILRILAAAPRPGLEPGRIADACKILSPSLTGILTRLEQMQLVSREWSEVDQRRQIIALTGRGVQLVGRVSPLIDAQYRRIEEILGPSGLEEIYRAIDRVVDLLDRPMPAALVEPEVRGKAARASRALGKPGARRIPRAGSTASGARNRIDAKSRQDP